MLSSWTPRLCTCAIDQLRHEINSQFSRLFALYHDTPLFAPADESKTAALADASGATAAGSLQDLARNCGSIITMLPNTPHVEAVYMGKPPTVLNPSNIGDVSSSTTRAAAGEHAGDAGRDIGGLVGWVEKGTLLVDSSTIDPLTSRKINAAAARNVSEG